MHKWNLWIKKSLIIPGFFLNNPKNEVLQQQMNAKSVTCIDDEKYTTETLLCVFEYLNSPEQLTIV